MKSTQQPFVPIDEVEFRYTPSPRPMVGPAHALTASLLANLSALAMTQHTTLAVEASILAFGFTPLIWFVCRALHDMFRGDQVERVELADWLRTVHHLELGGPVAHATSLFDGRHRCGILDGASGTVILTKSADGTLHVRWSANHYPPKR